MPYYIYRVTNPRTLEFLSSKERYQEARALVRELRTQTPEASAATVRMVFAKSTGEAERLLSVPRDERVIGDD
jgi:hypothetical protein